MDLVLARAPYRRVSPTRKRILSFLPASLCFIQRGSETAPPLNSFSVSSLHTRGVAILSSFGLH
eukprot:3356620-Rhodomonas_salina.1